MLSIAYRYLQCLPCPPASASTVCPSTRLRYDPPTRSRSASILINACDRAQNVPYPLYIICTTTASSGSWLIAVGSWVSSHFGHSPGQGRGRTPPSPTVLRRAGGGGTCTFSCIGISHARLSWSLVWSLDLPVSSSFPIVFPLLPFGFWRSCMNSTAYLLLCLLRCAMIVVSRSLCRQGLSWLLSLYLYRRRRPDPDPRAPSSHTHTTRIHPSILASSCPHAHHIASSRVPATIPHTSYYRIPPPYRTHTDTMIPRRTPHRYSPSSLVRTPYDT
ncbi:hypothetical protein K466DRAFT_161581 [Polyporus arcularius HHB13444]|uniref:Uncharacterized protein n=1 Tax=Polyporus arcularius HHB13444 TaxID=1314778 RepID=A0A5C3Q3T1_9APHY|nr:hypothetical protein K466DRAFT_161581 [Polyporus arcularius HHB13444]